MSSVREGENRDRLKQVIEEKIGKECFEKAEVFKQWLNQQEERDMILAYLRNW